MQFSIVIQTTFAQSVHNYRFYLPTHTAQYQLKHIKWSFEHTHKKSARKHCIEISGCSITCLPDKRCRHTDLRSVEVRRRRSRLADTTTP